MLSFIHRLSNIDILGIMNYITGLSDLFFFPPMGHFNPKAKVHILFCCELQRFGEIGHRDVYLASHIMELDVFQLVVLMLAEKYIWRSVGYLEKTRLWSQKIDMPFEFF